MKHYTTTYSLPNSSYLFAYTGRAKNEYFASAELKSRAPNASILSTRLTDGPAPEPKGPEPLVYYNGFFIQKTTKGYDLIDPKNGKHKPCKSEQACKWWAGIMNNLNGVQE